MSHFLSFLFAPLCLVSFVIPTHLHAETAGKPVIETAHVDTGAADARPTLSIESRVDNGRYTRTKRVGIRSDQTISLRVKASPNATVRWYQIFADLTQNYQNANPPWEPNPYRWRGFAQIRYYRIEIPEFQNQREVNPIAYLETTRNRIQNWFRENGNDSYGLAFYQSRYGTFQFQVEVSDDRGTRRSPGIEDRSERGLPKSILQINLREEDTYIGRLRSFHNVPGVFGSVLSQSIDRIGADCADILMAAWAVSRRKKLDKNYNVQMLVSKFKNTARTRIVNGRPVQRLTWGNEVRPGDFIAVSYSEDARKYHHIGALLADENNNAELDPADSILHAGPDALHQTLLSDGAFDGQIVILRP